MNLDEIREQDRRNRRSDLRPVLPTDGSGKKRRGI